MAKRKSTKRIKKAASKRKPSKKARGKSNAAKQGWLRSMVHYLGLRLLLFGLLSCGAGSLWLNWQSDRAVDGLLSRPIWAEPGQVTGGTVIRTGLAIDAAALSGLLRDAGYSWVDSLDGNHEFVRGPKSIIVRVDERDTLVTFDDSGVSSVSPDGVLQVEGIELAGTHLVEGPIRDPIEKADVPKHLVDAILAMEDSRFYEHPGVDALGIIRALISNMISENGMQGGSTLTQQLAKNLFLTPERTLERKVRELFLAISIEKRLSKDAILELYLNQVYLGQVNGVGIGGVDQGARTYFGVRASRLNLAQAATLAGIISAPNRYSPIRHPEEATKRRNIVLKRMVDLGLVDPEMAGRAGRTSIRTTTPRSRKKSPWAVDYALEVVEGTLGADSIGNGALRIQTTIDPALQMVAERSVKEGMEALGDRAKAAQVALVAIDPSDGNVLAMVGGRAYGESSFN